MGHSRLAYASQEYAKMRLFPDGTLASLALRTELAMKDNPVKTRVTKRLRANTTRKVVEK
jgi:hypothetical protein